MIKILGMAVFGLIGLMMIVTGVTKMAARIRATAR